MAGYSGTPLVKKLGMKPGQRVIFINEPPEFQPLLKGMPRRARHAAGKRPDYVHLFVRNRAQLRDHLPRVKEDIEQQGMIWVSWPKKASGIKTDVTEDTVREVALPMGLVDVKVCAIDETWSGLKLVIRQENRKKA